MRTYFTCAKLALLPISSSVTTAGTSQTTKCRLKKRRITVMPCDIPFLFWFFSVKDTTIIHPQDAIGRKLAKTCYTLYWFLQQATEPAWRAATLCACPRVQVWTKLSWYRTSLPHPSISNAGWTAAAPTSIRQWGRLNGTRATLSH